MLSRRTRRAGCRVPSRKARVCVRHGSLKALQTRCPTPLMNKTRSHTIHAACSNGIFIRRHSKSAGQEGKKKPETNGDGEEGTTRGTRSTKSCASCGSFLSDPVCLRFF